MSETRRNGGGVTLVHTSDVHVDDGRIAAQHGGDGTGGLRAVLAYARDIKADVVLLAGDTFDNHMVTAVTIERAGRLLAEAEVPVVLLPGNHDPVTADSVYARGGYETIAGLRILGGREWVRLGAVELGLDCLRRYLYGLPVSERIDFERS